MVRAVLMADGAPRTQHPLDKLLATKDATLTSIASVCDVTPQAIYDWRRRVKEGNFDIPARHVAKLAAAFKVSKRSLRPDLY